MALLVLVPGCTSKELRACRDGAADPPAVHLQRCAPLIKGASCRRVVEALDGGSLDLLGLAESCRRDYCGQFAAPVVFCSGVRGSKTSGFAEEFAFFDALFEVDHGLSAADAHKAFFDAVFRLQKHVFDAEQLVLRHAALRFLVRGDSSSVTIEVEQPRGVEALTSAPATLTQDTCRAFVSNALDAGAIHQDEAVVIRAEKKVQFRVMKCLMEAVRDAGVASENLHLEKLSLERLR